MHFSRERDRNDIMRHTLLNEMGGIGDRCSAHQKEHLKSVALGIVSSI